MILLDVNIWSARIASTPINTAKSSRGWKRLLAIPLEWPCRNSP